MFPLDSHLLLTFSVMVILFSTNGILAMIGDVMADLYSHQLPR